MKDLTRREFGHLCLQAAAVMALPSELEAITKEESKYFPLAKGNTWTYVRNLLRPQEVSSYYEATVLSQGEGDAPAGSNVFWVEHLSSEAKKTSTETYTITGLKREGFEVERSAADVRDGRYDITSDLDTFPKVFWTYYNACVKESYTEGSKKAGHRNIWRFTAVLDPGTIVGRHKNPRWHVAAIEYDKSITVPAGRFGNILKNVTLVFGTNIADVIFKDAKPIYQKDRRADNCFMTVVYYAPKVGLVKEVQYNREGKETYTLELQSFNVKNFLKQTIFAKI
ncbi:MAG: hypothetical protein V1837_03540 [Candidatus Woesearchaeota archaeon]